jgi:hypothetical protein
MSVTQYAPDARYTAGNTVIGDAPAIANINAPKLAELAASITFEGATEAFGSSTNVTKGTRKMIADKVGKQRVTNREYQMENLTIMAGNPQDANELVDSFVPDSTHYLWIRPGVDDSTALAAAQKVQVIETTVDACDLRQVSTADGDEFAVVVSLSVQDRTPLLVAIAPDA